MTTTRYTEPYQITTIAILGGVSLTLTIITLTFALYNCFKHLFALRITKQLILLFYFFVFVSTLLQCI